jgi:hypothetical protein
MDRVVEPDAPDSRCEALLKHRVGVLPLEVFK